MSGILSIQNKLSRLSSMPTNRDSLSTMKPSSKIRSLLPKSGKTNWSLCLSSASKRVAWVCCWRPNQPLQSRERIESYTQSMTPWREWEEIQVWLTVNLSLKLLPLLLVRPTNLNSHPKRMEERRRLLQLFLNMVILKWPSSESYHDFSTLPTLPPFSVGKERYLIVDILY